MRRGIVRGNRRVVTLPDNPAVQYDNGSHRNLSRGLSLRRQIERDAHEFFV